jgi:four helix bundle protein
MVGREKKEVGSRKWDVGQEKRGFRKLVAWEKADELASAVFQALKERQAPPWLAVQTIRAAVSVPANIAEGYTRGALRDYLRFLDIARGSLAELEYYLHFMVTNQLMDPYAYESLARLHSEVGNLLVALIRSLRLKLKEGSWDRVRMSEGPVEYSAGSAVEDSLPSCFFPLPGGEV